MVSARTLTAWSTFRCWWPPLSSPSVPECAVPACRSLSEHPRLLRMPTDCTLWSVSCETAGKENRGIHLGLDNKQQQVWIYNLHMIAFSGIDIIDVLSFFGVFILFSTGINGNWIPARSQHNHVVCERKSYGLINETKLVLLFKLK